MTDTGLPTDDARALAEHIAKEKAAWDHTFGGKLGIFFNNGELELLVAALRAAPDAPVTEALAEEIAYSLRTEGVFHLYQGKGEIILAALHRTASVTMSKENLAEKLAVFDGHIFENITENHKNIYRKRADTLVAPIAGRDREALNTALQEIVLAIAFLGRDLSTYRMKSTGEDLIKRLSRADKLIRTALTQPAETPAAIAEVREIAASAIRTFCKSLGANAVTTSSDGIERIYYSGISLDALSVAVALALSTFPAPVPAGMREALKQSHEALLALKNAVEASKTMNGRQYIDLGIQVNNALVKAHDALALHYTAWLVEWPEDDNVPVRWWHCQDGWMRDANKATWFCRRSDAEGFMAAHRLLSERKVTEHKFISSLSAGRVDTP